MSARHQELFIDFDAIKARHPLAEYCRERGIELHRDGAPGQLVGLCPLHTEDTPSFTVYPDHHFHCYGCSAHGDVTDLEQARGGGTLAEAAERLGSERSQQIAPSPKAPKQEPAPIITKENPFGLPYLMSRQESGLCMEAATRLANDAKLIERVSGWRNWKPETILGLAIERSLGITSTAKLAFLYESGCKIRWQENGKRRIIWEFGKQWLWRCGFIAGAGTVFLTEGEVDAITLIDAGVEEQPDNLVVALPSGPFLITSWASLFAGKKIIVATDADEVGVKAAKHLLGALEPVATSVKRLALERIV
jgi:hypothetical protein